jgi:flavin reductase (DIM6/NTAB) family NADH-FMN oxidoreductase RutF
MKHELGIAQPAYVIEDWPGKYEVFSWLEYVVNIPNPIYLITTRKANGAPNAMLHSWGLLVGEREHYSSLLAVLNHTHTYANLLREREWCLNFPSYRDFPQCFETIYANGAENDEITDAGFTLETAQVVKAPRIAECALNLECRLEWEHPLYTASRWHLFAGKVLHVAMDEAAMAPDPVERMRALGLMYNIRSTINPLDGRYYGPNSLGLLNEVRKIFTDAGESQE